MRSNLPSFHPMQTLPSLGFAIVSLSLPLWAQTTDDLTLSEYSAVASTPLVLDLGRVAGLDVPSSTWQSESVPADAVTSWPIPGWNIAELDSANSQTDPGSMRAFVSHLAESSAEAGYFSPVFIGLNDGPVIPTPVLLVSFEQPSGATQNSSARSAFARGVLADFPDLEILAEDWAALPGTYKVKVNTRSGYRVLDIAAALATREGVRYAEPDWMITGGSSQIPTDTFFDQEWGLHNTGQSGGTVDMDLNAPEAWDITTGSAGLKVLIIDTGVDQLHPDLTQNPGVDVTTDGPGPGGPINSWDNHGTSVAGCVSASIDNLIGVVGMAPDCPSVSARTFISVDSFGSWTTNISWTVDALVHAEGVGVRVTNNSNAYGFTSFTIEDKYEATRDAGMIHFAAAGNSGVSGVTYPASLPSILSIGALNRLGGLAWFSNFGPDLDFVAPGEEITTTDRSGVDGYVAGEYVVIDGTSFASPYAAGVAALLLSKNPLLNADQIEVLLKSTIKELGPAGFDTTFGWGLLDAAAALEILDSPQAGLLSWGDDIESQVSSTPGGGTFTEVSGGGQHSLARKADGTVVGWGANGFGQVSDVPSTGAFVQVSAGFSHSLALRSDGAVEAWGDDNFGQVSGAPAGLGFIQIAAGDRHSLALHFDGSIVAWGSDANGQLSGTPIGGGFIHVAAGAEHSLALRADGSIVAWGADSCGQVSSAPVGTGFAQLAGGSCHSVALLADGTIVSWGSDSAGQVSTTPIVGVFSQVAASASHSVALRANGSLTSWGSDSSGQVLDTPSGFGFTRVASGNTNHVVALEYVDCNGNGLSDAQDILLGTSNDCDGNGRADECELASTPTVDIDSDGQLDKCVPPPLYADRYEISVAAGGPVQLNVKATQPGELYLVLQGVSGTSPGQVYGGYTIPLNFDAIYLHMLTNANSFVMMNSFGVLGVDPASASGVGTTTYNLPGGLFPQIVGLTAHFAFWTFNPLTGAPTSTSNAVPLVFKP
jgi:subtilisin family serine protease